MLKKSFHILCISPLFVPMNNSEAICGGKIIKSLEDNGNDITVSTFDYLQKKDRVYDDSRIWESLLDSTVSLSPSRKKDIKQSILSALRYHTISWARWVSKAVEHAESLYRIRPFDMVYSRSHPMSAHIAGYWIKQKLGIPWVANMNDPFDSHLDPNVNCRYSKMQRMNSNYWFRKTLRNADLVTYPSARLRDFHTRISGVKHHSEVIPHIGLRGKGHSNDSKFILIHAGKLGINQEGRSSQSLLKGLRLFLNHNRGAYDDVRLLFVGPEDKDTQLLTGELGLNSVVSSAGRVNYEDSLEYISKASVCVLVEAQMAEGIYFPSKLADYLMAKKPILALSPEIGVVSDMLPINGIVRINEDDHIAVGKAISCYYEAFKNGVLQDLSPEDEFIMNYESQNVAKKFIESISKVIMNNSSLKSA